MCIFRTYYQCQANGAKRGGYEAILKHCAAGTAFDPKSGICNHVSSLSCEKDPFELRGTPKITNTDIAYKQIPLLITYIDTYLTPNMPLIQLWCARSKWNMDEICSLNIHL